MCKLWATDGHLTGRQHDKNAKYYVANDDWDPKDPETDKILEPRPAWLTWLSPRQAALPPYFAPSHVPPPVPWPASVPKTAPKRAPPEPPAEMPSGSPPLPSSPPGPPPAARSSAAETLAHGNPVLEIATLKAQHHTMYKQLMEMKTQMQFLTKEVVDLKAALVEQQQTKASSSGAAGW